MIVRDVLGQKPPEMALVQGDDVVKQLTAAATDPALGAPFCQGLCTEVWRQVMLMDRIAAETSNPYLASRSQMRNRGAD